MLTMFQNTKIMTVEDSKMIRIWNPKKYQGRIISKHNDVITSILKVVDFRALNQNANMIVTSSMDGAIKCYFGQRLTVMIE